MSCCQVVLEQVVSMDFDLGLIGPVSWFWQSQDLMLFKCEPYLFYEGGREGGLRLWQLMVRVQL
jgi:hypothetical protein